MSDIEKKYDDIFSSVVKRALTTSRALETLAKRKKNKSVSIPYVFKSLRLRKLRSVSESDSLGASDQSQDSDDRDSMSPPAIRAGTEDSELISLSPSPSPSRPSEHKAGDCECGRHFADHLEVHRHMATEHTPSALSVCLECGASAKWLRRRNVCRICRQFVPSDMNDHLKSHYQDKTGKTALMECRRCYKTFSTLKEVREHERVHRNQPRNRRNFHCTTCHMEFDSRHIRDRHMIKHLGNSVWDQIQAFIDSNPACRPVNQCPICTTVMRARKSFKLHVLQHFVRDPSLLASFGVTGPSSESELCKQEPIGVKREIEDHGYVEGKASGGIVAVPVVKQEPE